MKSKLLMLALSVLFAAANPALAADAEIQQGRSGPAKPKDTKGLWSGVLTGTFQGQPFMETYAVVFDNNGQVALGTNDSTVGVSHNKCVLASYDAATGQSVGNCVELDGVAAGLPSTAHYVLTNDEQQIDVWISAPAVGFSISGHLYRP